jgi:hypothetical protein
MYTRSTRLLRSPGTTECNNMTDQQSYLSELAQAMHSWWIWPSVRCLLLLLLPSPLLAPPPCCCCCRAAALLEAEAAAVPIQPPLPLPSSWSRARVAVAGAPVSCCTTSRNWVGWTTYTAVADGSRCLQCGLAGGLPSLLLLSMSLRLFLVITGWIKRAAGGS